jgi:hypothetical protein
MKRFSLILIVALGAITDTIHNIVFWIIGILYVLALFLFDKDEIILSGLIVYSLSFIAQRAYGYYLVYSASGVIERDAIKKKHPVLTKGIKY